MERGEGKLQGVSRESPVTVLDLPGTYSLSPQSLDEEISRDVLFQRLPEVPSLDLVVIVVDASNLQRNLYFATQVIELGYPTLIALNMIDVAENNGHRVDAAKLAKSLGVPVAPIIASVGQGIDDLRGQTQALPVGWWNGQKLSILRNFRRWLVKRLENCRRTAETSSPRGGLIPALKRCCSKRRTSSRGKAGSFRGQFTR